MSDDGEVQALRLRPGEDAPGALRGADPSGTFEHTLNRLIDERFNLEVFEAHYKNDETGAPAYDPAILLKIILYAYARGVTSSREIARLCRENVVFMALSADSTPHFTTIAAFIARLGGSDRVGVPGRAAWSATRWGSIGREMFAVDGVKLPSNASKEWSGTRADFGKKIEKMERAVEHLVKRHREADAAKDDSPVQAARAKQIETLEAALAKVRGFLRCHADKVGASGRVKKSNITDPESAKMKTSKGVIQGYTGVAVVDAKHQIVVGRRSLRRRPGARAARPDARADARELRQLGRAHDVLAGAVLTADAGFHSEANLEYLEANGIDGYIADTMFRKRDPRFATAERHKPPCEPDPDRLFRPEDFQFDQARAPLHLSGRQAALRERRRMW